MNEKNHLNDPLFFVELDHKNLYKLSRYRLDKGGTLLVLICAFFPSNFDLFYSAIFPLVLSKCFSKSIQWQILCVWTFHWHQRHFFLLCDIVLYTPVDCRENIPIFDPAFTFIILTRSGRNSDFFFVGLNWL